MKAICDLFQRIQAPEVGWRFSLKD